jgi:hypothetical protein
VILLLAVTALAADPTLEVAVGRSATFGGELDSGITFDAAAGALAAPRLGVEGRAQVQLLPGGAARLRLAPAPRLHLLDPARRTAFRPSLLAMAGVAIGERPRPVLGAGVDLDLPTGWPHHVRVGAGAFTEPGYGGGVLLRVGLLGRMGKAAAEPEPEAAPAPAAPAADGTWLWWDPGTCAWVPDAPGHGWRPGDGIVLPTSASASAAGASTPAERRFGWLVVAGPPSTVVRLAGTEQPIGAEGIARLRAPEGELTVEVVGGGRTERFEVAIADGYTLWLRAAAPPEVRVLFDVGSSEVSANDRLLVQELARNRGGYGLRIAGSYSPEGDPAANLRLAEARGASIAALLRGAGVPDDRVVLLPPRPPEAGRSAAEQRAVVVEPFVPEGR